MPASRRTLLRGSPPPFGQTSHQAPLLIAVRAETRASRVRRPARCPRYERDHVVIWRESSAGVSMVAYFLARNIAELPAMLLRSLLFSAIFTAAMRPVFSTFQAFVLMALVAWHCSAVGHVISFLVPHAAAQIAGLAFAMVFGMLGSGLIINRQSMCESTFMSFIGWASFMNYSLDCSLVTVAKQLPESHSPKFLLNKLGMGGSFDESCWFSPDDEARKPGGMYAKPLLALFWWGLALRVLACFLLVWTKRDKQNKSSLREVLVEAMGCRAKPAQEDAKSSLLRKSGAGDVERKVETPIV